MKILIVHNFYKEYGGEDISVNNQVDLLENNDIEVVNYFINSSAIDSFSKLDKFRLLKSAYASSKTEKDVLDIIKKFKPDIAHVHNVYPLISPIIYKVLHDNKIPIVQTLHNYRFICPNGLLFNQGEVCTKCLDTKNYYHCVHNKCYHNSILQSFWYADIISKGQKYFKYINKFIALTQFTKNMMTERGYAPDKISIVPNFTNTTKYEPIEKENYFLYIGRFSSEKGINILLKASEMYQGKSQIYFAGKGDLLNKITSSKKVKYIGFINGDEKIDFIRKAKAIIVPSVCYEVFGMSVIESFSHGTLVISSQIGGLQSLIENGYNGFLFDPANAQDLVRKMEMLDDKKELERMSKNAINTYRAKYTPDIHFKRLMGIYNELTDDTKNKI